MGGLWRLLQRGGGSAAVQEDLDKIDELCEGDPEDSVGSALGIFQHRTFPVPFYIQCCKTMLSAHSQTYFK